MGFKQEIQCPFNPLQYWFESEKHTRYCTEACAIWANLRF